MSIAPHLISRPIARAAWRARVGLALLSLLALAPAAGRIALAYTAPTFVSQFGGPSTFNSLEGLTVDGSGHIYVADTANNRVMEYDANGTYVRQFGGLSQPTSIAVDGSGNVYVTDANERVAKFDAAGTYVGQFGNGRFVDIFGIGIDNSSGHIYVDDYLQSRVVVFDAQGNYVSEFGNSGGAGQLSNPTGLTVDAGGNVYVADGGHGRVVEYSAGGTYLNQFGGGQLSYPYGVAVDSAGYAYVADAYAARIVVFDATTGSYVSQFGGYSYSGYGGFALPYDVAIDNATGRLSVSDDVSDLVQTFQVSEATCAPCGGPTATPELGSGRLLAAGLLAIAGVTATRRRQRRHRRVANG